MEAQALAQVQEEHTHCKRDDLTKKIKENRDQHILDYAKAIKGWRKEFASTMLKHAKACEALADKASSDAAEDSITYQFPDLPTKPENHVKDYDRIIARLEMSQDGSIYLKHSDFNKYVLDEWRWKAAFTESLSNYAR
jgi:hypothetical protein